MVLLSKADMCETRSGVTGGVDLGSGLGVRSYGLWAYSLLTLTLQQLNVESLGLS